MIFIFSSVFLLYLLFVTALIAGWNKAISQKISTIDKPESLLSIIIPVRNEGKVLANLLEDLKNQSFRNFEVIVVNDHSQDNTREVALAYAQRDTRFKLLDSNREGKKMALTQGIQQSTGEIIVSTDGDCRVNYNWLESLFPYFQQEKCKMVFGGVKIEGSSIFSKIQEHEFLSLIGTAAATLAFGVPSMCNGANLAFRKALFMEVGGYTDNLHIPSGDDEFLMHKIFSRYPDGIVFMANEDCIVRTAAASSVKQFVHQRIRWAGKWKYRASRSSTLLAIFIFCFQGAVILLPVAMILAWVDPIPGVLLLAAKTLIELIFLRRVAVFMQVSWSSIVFVLLQLGYPVYVVFIALIANISRFEWKERKLKSFIVKGIKN